MLGVHLEDEALDELPFNYVASDCYKCPCGWVPRAAPPGLARSCFPWPRNMGASVRALSHRSGTRHCMRWSPSSTPIAHVSGRISRSGSCRSIRRGGLPSQRACSEASVNSTRCLWRRLALSMGTRRGTDASDAAPFGRRVRCRIIHALPGHHLYLGLQSCRPRWEQRGHA